MSSPTSDDQKLPNKKTDMSPLAKRLREARQTAGLSLEKLGIDAGLDPASARTRMSRYELGKRVPDYELVEKLAAVLGLPVTYFFASDDEEAELLVKFHQLTKSQRLVLAQVVHNLPQPSV